jgi:hypothetical protein
MRARDLSGGKPYSESYSGHNLKEAKAMKWNRAILAFLVFVFAGLIAYAAQQSSQSKMGKMSSTRSVTGCLQKGDEANEYSITGANGKMYGLMSSKIDLSKHVGHKVRVTGMVKPEKGESAAAGGNEKEAADIEVTHLKMISTSCQ